MKIGQGMSDLQPWVWRVPFLGQCILALHAVTDRWLWLVHSIDDSTALVCVCIWTLVRCVVTVSSAATFSYYHEHNFRCFVVYSTGLCFGVTALPSKTMKLFGNDKTLYFWWQFAQYWERRGSFHAQVHKYCFVFIIYLKSTSQRARNATYMPHSQQRHAHKSNTQR